MDYSSRLAKLQLHLQQANCDILLIENLIDIYYMTGLELSAGKLLVDSEGACLIVDSRYYENCQKHCPFSVLLLSENAFENWICERSSLSTIGFDSTTTSYSRYQELKKQIRSLKKRLSEKHPLKLVSLSSPLRMIRCIKDADEIALLKTAADLGSEGYDFLCNSLVQGISEKELALELEIFWKRKGSKALAFDPIIAFGPNSSMPHYRPSNRRLKQGDCVLIDIGVNVEHYHSDMTRVIFFGPKSKKIEEIYAIVREAQQRALQLCAPGTPIKELDKAARNYIASKGYGDKFTHNLGHGIGLEIHEAPSLNQKGPDRNVKLQEGMAITIEPGIYLPDIGGVRLEDSIVITSKGYENLTKRPL